MSIGCLDIELGFHHATRLFFAHRTPIIQRFQRERTVTHAQAKICATPEKTSVTGLFVKFDTTGGILRDSVTILERPREIIATYAIASVTSFLRVLNAHIHILFHSDSPKIIMGDTATSYGQP